MAGLAKIWQHFVQYKCDWLWYLSGSLRYVINESSILLEQAQPSHSSGQHWPDECDVALLVPLGWKGCAPPLLICSINVFYGRQPPPAMLAAGHSVLLLSYRSYVFAAWSPMSLGRSSPNFATCSLVTQIYKIRSQIWVVPSPRNMAAQEHQNFRAISHNSRLDREYLRKVTRHRQSENGVANYTDTRAKANLIRCTLVHKRRKIGPEFTPTEYQLYRTLISRVLRSDAPWNFNKC